MSPPGFGIEIPTGVAITARGYQSAGLLVNYSPVQASSAATSAMHWNHIPEVTPHVDEHIVKDAQDVITEKHYIAPQGVFRVQGWNSTSQTPLSWTDAPETLVEVYDPADYASSSHTFTGVPHSYHRIEIATGNNLADGIRLVQSNHGLVRTRTFQASSDELLLRDTNGSHVTQSIALPPSGESWQLHTTETTDGFTSSSLSETYARVGLYYEPTVSTRDPSAAPNDELTTYTSYYFDGRVRSISRPDGSWTCYTYDLTYSGNPNVTTYSSWLSASSPLSGGGYSPLPSSGVALKTGSTSDAEGSTSWSYLVDLASEGGGVQISEIETSISTDTGIPGVGMIRTIRTESRGDGHSISTGSIAYAPSFPDRFLAGRTFMEWDPTGKATRYQYQRGIWEDSVFSPSILGTCVRVSTIHGYMASPNPGAFTELPYHSTNEVTITAAAGIVREETHICVSPGNYQLAVAKNHEYEASGRFRRTATKIDGHYVSRTGYPSHTITRQWSEDGAMTETETNAEGEVIRTTSSGINSVPAVTTTFEPVGLTTTTKVNGRIVSVQARDAVGREVYHRDAIGAVVETDYAAGGNIVTRTAPGGVITVETRHSDGQLLSTTGSGVISRYYSYSVEPGGLVTTTTALGSENSLRTSTITKYWDGSTAFETTPDPAGGTTPVTRSYQYASGSSALLRIHSSAPNTADSIQINPSSSPAASMGHYSLSGLETDGNGPVIGAITDRLTETSTSYGLSGGVWNQHTITRVFPTESPYNSYTRISSQALAPVAVSRDGYGDGLRWTSTTSNGTTKVTTNRDLFFAEHTSVISTDDSATTASSDSEIINLHGKTVSSSAYGVTHPETMVYDASGHLIRQTSATGALTVHGYNPVGQLETTMNHEGKSEIYSYYPANHRNAGLLWKTSNPENETTETVYNKRGQLEETKGTGTYRVKYEYNSNGERVSMRTYRTAESDGDLTQWTPDPATGVLTDKTDALGRVTHYTYDSAGRLETRTWARPGTIKTTYGYNAFGDLLSIIYSDGVTPNVGIVPDRLGRPYKITDASGTRTLSYHPVTGALDLISYDGTGLLPITELNYEWDTALRPVGYNVSGGGPSAVIGYDDEGRLKTVASAGFTHTHGYIPGTGTLSSLTTTEGSNTVLTRTLYHDRMQRLRGIQTKNDSGTTLSRHGYTLDGAGRRTKANRENGQRWDYQYDPLGQVIDAVKKFPDGTAIPGHSFAFSYDEIGNRLTATHGGEGTVVTYPKEDTNALNQYTKITTEGGRFILGEAPAANAVTINGDTASRVGGFGFYWKQITGDNSSAPLWSYDTIASNGITITGNTWTPMETVAPVHDLDGNLTYDGRWDYSWDAENRLASMTTAESAAYAGVPRQRLDFVYDSHGRRVSKTVSNSSNGTTWTFGSSSRFLYDNWNLIAEYSAPSATSTALTLQASHTWGIDLSGTPQGAGGVGGLLSSTLISQSPISNVPYFPSYDGNGNISAWSDATGTLLARMDYSPFGQLIAQYKFTGDATLLRLNFGFSTKFTDVESGLLYYGYRYYDPVAGRWISRDPLGERGGVNLYNFAYNQALCYYDVLGWFPHRSNFENGIYDMSNNNRWRMESEDDTKKSAGRYQKLKEIRLEAAKYNSSDIMSAGARGAILASRASFGGPRLGDPVSKTFETQVEYGGRVCCNKGKYTITGPYTTGGREGIQNGGFRFRKSTIPNDDQYIALPTRIDKWPHDLQNLNKVELDKLTGHSGRPGACPEGCSEVAGFHTHFTDSANASLQDLNLAKRRPEFISGSDGGVPEKDLRYFPNDRKGYPITSDGIIIK